MKVAPFATERIQTDNGSEFAKRFEELDEPEVFNEKLMGYLVWYNVEKPHRGLGDLQLLRYYLDNFYNRQKSNMLWTLTLY